MVISASITTISTRSRTNPRMPANGRYGMANVTAMKPSVEKDASRPAPEERTSRLDDECDHEFREQ